MDVAKSMQDTKNKVVSKASDVADAAYEKGEAAADTAGKYAGTMMEALEHSARERPMMTILGAAVVGLAVGAMLRR